MTIYMCMYNGEEKFLNKDWFKKKKNKAKKGKL